MGEGVREPVPFSYKAWVFGSKLVGVLVFAVGIEMLARGEPLWAGLLLLVGAVVVLAPVRSPEGWRKIDKGRV
jgi:hypothetical protein